MATEGFAPAKINLTLHVTGRRADGYHLLDSLVVFADVGDRVWLDPEAPPGLRVVGPFAGSVPAGDDNLVMRAASLMGRLESGLVLEKNLPPASGIGGGSSDAAAVLRLLPGEAPAPDAVLRLGADVPVCLMRRNIRMSGIGETLEPVEDLPPLWSVLANPGVEVPTPSVFRALARRDNPAMPRPLPNFGSAAELIGWASTMRNDLEEPAVALAPVIAEVIDSLRAQPRCQLARMSGSGATCFGLYADAESAAAAEAALRAARPEWWVRAARLGLS